MANKFISTKEVIKKIRERIVKSDSELVSDMKADGKTEKEISSARQDLINGITTYFMTMRMG